MVGLESWQRFNFDGMECIGLCRAKVEHGSDVMHRCWRVAPDMPSRLPSVLLRCCIEPGRACARTRRSALNLLVGPDAYRCPLPEPLLALHALGANTTPVGVRDKRGRGGRLRCERARATPRHADAQLLLAARCSRGRLHSHAAAHRMRDGGGDNRSVLAASASAHASRHVRRSTSL